jgi:hypothetical protein
MNESPPMLHLPARDIPIPTSVSAEAQAGHGGFFGMAPEDEEITREIRRFADAHWGAN